MRVTTATADRMIGVVGGVGSYAGLDLLKKIYDYSGARSDQEHPPVSMLSVPHRIMDRSKFILREIDENPGHSIAEIITTLYRSGAGIIGIPCNTAHAPEIFEAIVDSIPKGCTVVHMIEEVAHHIRLNFPDMKKVGVLATNGTYLSKVYPTTFSKHGIAVVQPSRDIQNRFVHPAIYDRHYGIKAYSNPVAEMAKSNLLYAASYLEKLGAEAIILGCTEIPLAIQERRIGSSVVIDSTSVLAKALLRKLREPGSSRKNFQVL